MKTSIMKTSVAKLDQTIAKLQELRRLASDPTLGGIVEVNFRRLRAAVRPPTVRTATKRLAVRENGNLRNSVLSISKRFRRNYTMKDVLAKMKSNGFRFESANPKKSIGKALRALVLQKKVLVSVPSAGKIPTKYAASARSH